MDRFDYVVIGAGFAGSVCAERLAAAGHSVLVVEQRPHVGGNAYDRYNEDGILVHEYGAHIFHTNARAVFDYLSRFTEWRRFEHRVVSSVAGKYVPFPINRTTLATFGGDDAAARAALIAPYTAKQWGAHAAHLDPSVLARVKSRDTVDDRYFLDTYQAMPSRGYTALFQRMLDHPGIRVALGLSYAESRRQMPDVYAQAAGVIFTGPIDEFFDYQLGRLPYRSARFLFSTVPAGGFVLPAPVVNYPTARVPFTRIAEFRQITGQPHPLTTIAWEFPCDDPTRPFWPVPTAASAALAQQYRELAKQHPTVHFCGRLGTFRYLNIDQAVAQALKLSARLVARLSQEVV